MAFQMQPVPDVPGTMLSDVSFWRGLTFIVNGQRVKPHGLLPRRVTLPSRDGPVEGKLKGGLPGAQQLIVAGSAYPTGPPVPTGLRIVAVLPLVLTLLVKGGFRTVVALTAVVLNTQIITSTRPRSIQVGLMLATLLVGAGVNVAIAVALRATWWR